MKLDNARRRRKPRYLNELRRYIGQQTYTLSAMRPDPVRDTIADLLEASDVDRAALAKLATREHVADAADQLVRAIRPRISAGLVADLYAPPAAIFIPARMAMYLGLAMRPARDRANQIIELVTTDEIRLWTHEDGARGLRARIALAIIGEPVAAYSELSRRERAGLILGRLIALWRERPI